jgi:hypothetical protein
MDIQCTFENGCWNSIGERYTCCIRSANITTREYVKSFIGNHKAGRTNQNVEVLCIHINSNFHFIPRGISRIFPNLVVIWIYRSGLKEILADDFLGLEHLEKIDIHDSQLTTLPSDLFMHTRKLKSFDIIDKQLKNADSRMFDLIPDDQWERICLKIDKNNEILYEPRRGRGLQSLKEVKSQSSWHS